MSEIKIDIPISDRMKGLIPSYENRLVFSELIDNVVGEGFAHDFVDMMEGFKSVGYSLHDENSKAIDFGFGTEDGSIGDESQTMGDPRLFVGYWLLQSGEIDAAKGILFDWYKHNTNSATRHDSARESFMKTLVGDKAVESMDRNFVERGKFRLQKIKLSRILKASPGQMSVDDYKNKGKSLKHFFEVRK